MLAESYFTAYGMRKSYGAAAETVPNFAALVADSSVNVGMVVGSIAALHGDRHGGAGGGRRKAPTWPSSSLSLPH